MMHGSTKFKKKKKKILQDCCHMFYDRCCLRMVVVLFQLLLQLVWLIAIHVKSFLQICVLLIMNATFSTWNPVHAIPGYCAVLICMLGAMLVCFSCSVCKKIIMLYGYDSPYFYVFHIYAAF